MNIEIYNINLYIYKPLIYKYVCICLIYISIENHFFLVLMRFYFTSLSTCSMFWIFYSLFFPYPICFRKTRYKKWWAKLFKCIDLDKEQFPATTATTKKKWRVETWSHLRPILCSLCISPTQQADQLLVTYNWLFWTIRNLTISMGNRYYGNRLSSSKIDL